MDNNEDIINRFLLIYNDHNFVIEFSPSGKHFAGELLIFGYKIYLINSAEIREIIKN